MNPQLKKGALELCVRARLRDRDCYGYDLTEQISKEIKTNRSGIFYSDLREL